MVFRLEFPRNIEIELLKMQSVREMRVELVGEKGIGASRLYS